MVDEASGWNNIHLNSPMFEDEVPTVTAVRATRHAIEKPQAIRRWHLHSTRSSRVMVLSESRLVHISFTPSCRSSQEDLHGMFYHACSFPAHSVPVN